MCTAWNPLQAPPEAHELPMHHGKLRASQNGVAHQHRIRVQVVPQHQRGWPLGWVDQNNVFMKVIPFFFPFLLLHVVLGSCSAGVMLGMDLCIVIRLYCGTVNIIKWQHRHKLRESKGSTHCPRHPALRAKSAMLSASALLSASWYTLAIAVWKTPEESRPARAWCHPRGCRAPRDMVWMTIFGNRIRSNVVGLRAGQWYTHWSNVITCVHSSLRSHLTTLDAQIEDGRWRTAQ